MPFIAQAIAVLKYKQTYQKKIKVPRMGADKGFKREQQCAKLLSAPLPLKKAAFLVAFFTWVQLYQSQSAQSCALPPFIANLFI
jgi:hypothetical protein